MTTTLSPESFVSSTFSTTVPAEIYRFIPGSTTISSNASNSTTNRTESTAREPVFNSTGYFIEDEVEPGLSELQTLFLACIATFIPLIIALFAVFGIRMLWTKYRRYRDCNNYDGDVLHRDESSEPLSRSLCSHLLNGEQMKCSETHFSINPEDVEICDGTTTTTITNGPNNCRSTNHSNTNGSIITMTLKNNHLIVETEERNDIEEDSRETTMKYSPGARDGVFVVEVQQGSRRSPGSGGPSFCMENERSGSVSDQCALVHNPPDRYNDEDTLEECEETDYYVETSSPNRDASDSCELQLKTGLTQSDLSLSSATQTYRYGNQQGYDIGSYGYPIYNGYTYDEPCRRITVTSKPKIVSGIYKVQPKVGPDVLQNDHLLSGSLTKAEYIPSSEELDSIQEEQIRLGNAMPVEIHINETNDNTAPPYVKEAVLCHIKQQILPVSQKFEKLENDISPSFDSMEKDVSPMEFENRGYESSNDLSKS